MTITLLLSPSKTVVSALQLDNRNSIIQFQKLKAATQADGDLPFLNAAVVGQSDQSDQKPSS